MNPTSCLFGKRFAWAQTTIFSAEPCSKNAGNSTIGRKDSTQTVIRTSRRLDSFLYEAAGNFEVSSNIKNKLINQKPIAVKGTWQ